MMKESIAALILASTAFAQCTGPDVLVDDFSQSRRLFFDGADRQVNLLDADYGTDNPATTITVDTSARTLTVFAGTNSSFFFAKYVSRLNYLSAFAITKQVDCSRTKRLVLT
jgi:predicted ATPase